MVCILVELCVYVVWVVEFGVYEFVVKFFFLFWLCVLCEWLLVGVDYDLV